MTTHLKQTGSEIASRLRKVRKTTRRGAAKTKRKQTLTRTLTWDRMTMKHHHQRRNHRNKKNRKTSQTDGIVLSMLKRTFLCSPAINQSSRLNCVATKALLN